MPNLKAALLSALKNFCNVNSRLESGEGKDLISLNFNM